MLETYDFQTTYTYVRKNKVFGWGFQWDLERMHYLASEVPEDLGIVELGSFKGLSTIFLAAGAKSGYGTIVTAVDHFLGSDEHQKDWTPEEIRRDFFNNVKESGLDNIEVMEMTTLEAAKKYNGQVKLLFIDASHRYEDIKDDFNAWYPKVITGGNIIIHDAVTWAEPKKFYNEILSTGLVIPDTNWKDPIDSKICAGFLLKK